MVEVLASAASDLLTGPNIPFVASFVLALLLTVLSVMGVGHASGAADSAAEASAEVAGEAGGDAEMGGDADSFAGADTDHNVELDHDAGLDHDTAFGHDATLDHDATVEAEASAAHDAEAGHHAEVGAGGALTLQSVLYFFGIGRVPLSIVLMSFAYAFGVVGWLLNTVLAQRGGGLGSWFSASLAGALVAGLASMRLVSGAVGRVMPTQRVSGFSRREFIGHRGVTALPVDERGGRVTVTDPEGTRHEFRCCVAAGAQALPRGTKVILLKYVPTGDAYQVAPERR